jgi:hypothetical protein
MIALTDSGTIIPAAASLAIIDLPTSDGTNCPFAGFRNVFLNPAHLGN